MLYCYSPDRKGEHPRTHLAPFRGILQADGYAGYAGLYERGVTEAACWAHARRKFFDVHAATKSPLALEALQRIAAWLTETVGQASHAATRLSAARKARNATTAAAAFPTAAARPGAERVNDCDTAGFVI